MSCTWTIPESSVAKQIGKLTHPHWTATLSSDGLWKCSMPAMEETLNLEYSPRLLSSPADGAYGYAQFHDAAKDWGATISELTPPPRGSEPKGIDF